MELLPHLLPRSDTQVSLLINMVCMDSGNGYDILWRVMALSVPGFDPTLQVKIPAWDNDGIFDFALSFLLYFRLLPRDVMLKQVGHTVAAGPVVAPPPETTPVILPPPEPPPVDLPGILDCLPPEDHAAFATQFIAEELDTRRYSGPAHPSLGVAGVASPLVVLQQRPSPSPPPHRPGLVEYAIPMEKARPKPQSYIPQGLIFDPGIMICPSSPVTPFEFPFNLPRNYTPSCFDETTSLCMPMDSVMRVVGLPWVYGLKGDEGSYVKVMHSARHLDPRDHPSLMDGGANICITGILGLLVDMETIPPLLILVATTSDSFSLDDCCTKKGFIPLTLLDGSVYYQLCYYCKNATETIISPKAIIAASDTLVHWTQEGHRGDAPGSIRFSSDSGLYSITLHLEKWDGLYYCPTDVFTVKKDPVHHHIPVGDSPLPQSQGHYHGAPSGIYWSLKIA